MHPEESKKSEATFQRCQHDRQNPYVMISREMAQDKSISPKAKGVLLYLLSLPPDWKIYHSQLQDGLGVGEDYVNSAMDELIKEGYADRTRERVKGIFQPYSYVIREFKKCSPNLENRPGLAGPGNPALQSKEQQNTQTDVLYVPPNGGGEESSFSPEEDVSTPHSATIRKSENISITVTKSELYERILRNRCDWSKEEIVYAWQSLCDYTEVIHDWWKFIIGTVNNYQRKTKNIDSETKRKQNSPRCHQKATTQEVIQDEPVVTDEDRALIKKMFIDKDW